METADADINLEMPYPNNKFFYLCNIGEKIVLQNPEESVGKINSDLLLLPAKVGQRYIHEIESEI